MNELKSELTVGLHTLARKISCPRLSVSNTLDHLKHVTWYKSNSITLSPNEKGGQEVTSKSSEFIVNMYFSILKIRKAAFSS